MNALLLCTFGSAVSDCGSALRRLLRNTTHSTMEPTNRVTNTRRVVIKPPEARLVDGAGRFMMNLQRRQRSWAGMHRTLPRAFVASRLLCHVGLTAALPRTFCLPSSSSVRQFSMEGRTIFDRILAKEVRVHDLLRGVTCRPSPRPSMHCAALASHSPLTSRGVCLCMWADSVHASVRG